MLVTDPAGRATLTEVLSHPWMVLGFNGPPDPHMPHREPIRADELDREVIRGMTGFEFGSEQDIEKKLLAILESEEYIRAVQHWKERNIGGHLKAHDSQWADVFSLPAWGDPSKADLSLSLDHNTPPKRDHPTPPKKTRRFSGFDLSRRKRFSASSKSVSPIAPSHPDSENHPSLNDPNREPLDPTSGYHPLLSIYYLVREKKERDRTYGAGPFVQSPSGPPSPSNMAPSPLPSSATLHDDVSTNPMAFDLSSQERDQAEAKKEEGARGKEELLRNEEVDRRKEQEVKRKEQEVRKKEEETKKKDEEFRKKDEEVRKRETEVRKHEEGVKKREMEMRKHEEEVRKREEDARQYEEELRKREEEVRKYEEEVGKRAEEAQRKELEVKQKNEALDVDMVCARLFTLLQTPESFKKLVCLQEHQTQEMMDLFQKVRLAISALTPCSSGMLIWLFMPALRHALLGSDL